jgi:hypothetical protein
MEPMKRIGVLVLTALAVAACGGDDDIAVDNAWSRTSASGVTLGVVYMDLTAADDDTLVAVSVPDDIAGSAGIHEVVAAGDEMSGDMEMSGDDMEMSGDDMEMSGDDMSGEDMGDMDMGEMRMQQMTDGLPLPAGETVALEPGSYHIMLLDLVEPLEPGDEFDVTLDFATADDVSVAVEVSDEAP